MREGGDGASSQELFLNKPVSRGSKIAEVEVRIGAGQVRGIVLYRAKTWQSFGLAREGAWKNRGRKGWRDVAQKYWKGREEGKRAPALDKLYCPLLFLPSLLRFPLSGHPLEMFRGTTCSTTYPVPWKRIAAQNFRNQPNNRAGFSQLFRNEEDSTMSNPNYELTFSCVNSIMRFCM